MSAYLACRVLMFCQYLARLCHHLKWQPSQLCHLDSVAAVCRARSDFAQEDNSATGLLHGNVVVLYARELFGQFRQFEIVSGKQGLGSGAAMDVLDRCPRDG